MKERRLATEVMIRKAIKKHKPFRNYPDLKWYIVMPEDYPHYKANKGRRNRCRIEEKGTGRVLARTPSGYEMLDKIEAGWTHTEEPEGLIALIHQKGSHESQS